MVKDWSHIAQRFPDNYMVLQTAISSVLLIGITVQIKERDIQDRNQTNGWLLLLQAHNEEKIIKKDIETVGGTEKEGKESMPSSQPSSKEELWTCQEALK